MFFSATIAIATLLRVASGAAIPSGCTAEHLVVKFESCVSIVNIYNNFTATDLYHWNPSIGLSCGGLIAGSSICINLPPYDYPGPIQAGTIFTAAQDPVPQLPKIVPGCKTFQYTDASGHPTLEQMLSDNGITRIQWNAYNWYKEKNAYDSKWPSYFSCVGRT